MEDDQGKVRGNVRVGEHVRVNYPVSVGKSSWRGMFKGIVWRSFRGEISGLPSSIVSLHSTYSCYHFCRPSQHRLTHTQTAFDRLYYYRTSASRAKNHCRQTKCGGKGR